ncbi:MAG: GNAT family N-acetyltransferase [Terriglobia bacterium]
MTRLSSSIRESVASLGWANGLLDILARSLNRGSRGRCRLFKYYFVAQPVPPQAGASFGKSSKTRIYQASSADGIILQSPRPPAIIAKRFADGAVCIVGEQGARFVGFIWITRETYCEDEVRCRYRLDPAGHLAWDFDAYVAPAFRSSRAFAQLWEATNRFLREHRVRWTVSRISAFNAGSLAAHRRLGIMHLHSGVFLVIGGLQLAWFSCSPYLHVSTRATHFPELLFHAPAESP